MKAHEAAAIMRLVDIVADSLVTLQSHIREDCDHDASEIAFANKDADYREVRCSACGKALEKGCYRE